MLIDSTTKGHDDDDDDDQWRWPVGGDEDECAGASVCRELCYAYAGVLMSPLPRGFSYAALGDKR